MNRGILSASLEFDYDRIRALLPPEHRIIGTMRPVNVPIIDYLIEGDSMPTPIAHVTLLCTQSTADGETIIRGHWQHDPSFSWLVERGPSVADDEDIFKLTIGGTGYQKRGFAV